ncbi:MAG: MucB/RseB C-terminal domain-containing protein [Pseudomonadota bacterium]
MMLRTCLAALLVCGLIASDVRADPSTDWLQRMSESLENASYRGLVIREQPSRSDTFKVYHTVRDGVIRERLVRQEGDGFEIIRNGKQVHCVLPDKQAVLVEAWDGQGTLFSRLPDNIDSLLEAYRFDVVGEARVAGRQSVVIAIAPKDGLRFSRRLWLDAETGFPLKSERSDHEGTLVERIRFADIELGADLAETDLQSRYPLDDFRWYPVAEPTLRAVKSTWHSAALPAGYRMESGQVEKLDKDASAVTHIVYTDGLSRVSVFIKSGKGKTGTSRGRVGNTHSFSTLKGDYRITAVGEVPPAAVEQIALSMQR